jgi:hypothetical protein
VLDEKIGASPLKKPWLYYPFCHSSRITPVQLKT